MDLRTRSRSGRCPLPVLLGLDLKSRLSRFDGSEIAYPDPLPDIGQGEPVPPRVPIL
jgi:hypothetical protein